MIRSGSKRTISVSGGLGRLQMVLEPVTERCAREDAGPSKRVDCEIPHRMEKGTSIPYKGVKTFL